MNSWKRKAANVQQNIIEGKLGTALTLALVAGPKYFYIDVACINILR